MYLDEVGARTVAGDADDGGLGVAATQCGLGVAAALGGGGGEAERESIAGGARSTRRREAVAQSARALVAERVSHAVCTHTQHTVTLFISATLRSDSAVQ